MIAPLRNIEPVSAPGLQLKEDIHFLKKEIIFQRVGRVVMLLLILGGSLGLFGTGFLSRTQKQKGNVQIDYGRFLRFNNEEVILFRLKNASGKTIIKIPVHFSENFEIQKIFPEPGHTEIRNGWMNCYFPAT